MLHTDQKNAERGENGDGIQQRLAYEPTSCGHGALGGCGVEGVRGKRSKKRGWSNRGSLKVVGSVRGY